MSYWSDRQEQLKKVAETDEEAIKKRLKKQYDKELRRLDREIAAYFQKYGEDNVIEYRQLMQQLDDADRTLLIEQMDEFAEKYPQYAHLMPVRESIYKLDRLQGLQYSVNIAQANIAGYTEEQIRQYETKLAQKGLNYSMETLGFGKNFYSINDNIVKTFVGAAWCNGENFSERIWNDTQKVANYINQDMAQAFARGDAYRRISQDLQRRFGTNYTNAYRLVFTEGTYVMAESSIKPFEEDFEQYEYSPILDGKTCPICRALAGKVFLISERQPGVNFPPMHPWCRCSWEPYVDDWDKWIDDYVAKRGGDRRQAEKIENRLKSDIIKAGGVADNFDRKARIFTVDEDLKATNPNYISGEYKWRNNCQRCVSAYEMRRRGYNVTAKPLPGKLADDYLAQWFEHAWENANTIFCNKGSGKKEIEGYMKQWGNGSRAVIRVKRRWGGGGHVFVAENIEGKIRYYDPQSGDNDCSGYFRDAREGKSTITRVDNLAPSEHIKDCCENVR